MFCTRHPSPRNSTHVIQESGSQPHTLLRLCGLLYALEMLKLVVGIAITAACLEIVLQAYVERRKTLRNNGDTFDSENFLIRQKVRILLKKSH